MGHKHEEVYDKYEAYGEHRPAVGYIERGKLARVYNLDRERGQEQNAGHKRKYVYRFKPHVGQCDNKRTRGTMAMKRQG